MLPASLFNINKQDTKEAPNKMHGAFEHIQCIMLKKIKNRLLKASQIDLTAISFANNQIVFYNLTLSSETEEQREL